MLTAAHIAMLLNWLTELQLLHKNLIWRIFVLIYIHIYMPTTLKTTTQFTVPFYTKLSYLLKMNEGSQSSLACPSDNRKHVHEVERCWNYTDSGKPNYWDSNLFQRHFVLPLSHCY